MAPIKNIVQDELFLYVEIKGQLDATDGFFIARIYCLLNMFLARALTRRLHIHTVNAHPTNGLPDPQIRANQKPPLKRIHNKFSL